MIKKLSASNPTQTYVWNFSKEYISLIHTRIIFVGLVRRRQSYLISIYILKFGGRRENNMSCQQGRMAIELYGTVYHHKKNSESKEKRMARRIEIYWKKFPTIQLKCSRTIFQKTVVNLKQTIKTINYLFENKKLSLLMWPRQTANLNPIEKLGLC